MDYHSRMTSLGTKRGVRPYWNKYRAGKEKGEKCPLHEACLSTRGKRDLYAHCCPHCKGQEGAYRADIRGWKHVDFKTYLQWEINEARSKTREELRRRGVKVTLLKYLPPEHRKDFAEIYNDKLDYVFRLLRNDKELRSKIKEAA